MYVSDPFASLGQRVEPRTSYIIKDKTVKGDPVIKVDSDKDYKVDADDPAIVVRKQADGGKLEWQPVKDAKEFKEKFEKASLQDKREHFGLWVDARKHLIMPKDGIPQDKEVTTLGQYWDNYTYQSTDKMFSKEYNQSSAWIENYSQVVGSEVKLSERESITGTVTSMEEPQKITKSKAEITTLWGLYGTGWRPAETMTYTQTL